MLTSLVLVVLFVILFELSIYLDHKVRALGIGAKLYEVMEHLLKQQGILNLYACIATPVDKPDEYLTDASLHFHHKQGFSSRNP